MHWPEKKSQSFLDSLLRQFKAETSSESLSCGTCACCAESTIHSQLEAVPLQDIDLNILKHPDFNSMVVDEDQNAENNHNVIPWLHPGVIHPPMPFVQGILRDILVNPEDIVSCDNQITDLLLCETCQCDLKAYRLPRLAIANRLFLRDVLDELKDLTAVKESMISLCQAKCTIIHLKADGTENSEDDFGVKTVPNQQRGMQGHVIMHAQRPDIVAESYHLLLKKSLLQSV